MFIMSTSIYADAVNVQATPYLAMWTRSDCRLVDGMSSAPTMLRCISTCGSSKIIAYNITICMESYPFNSSSLPSMLSSMAANYTYSFTTQCDAYDVLPN